MVSTISRTTSIWEITRLNRKTSFIYVNNVCIEFKLLLSNTPNPSSIAIKSDHVRIIARKTKDKLIDSEPDDVSEINGTIRIIKEGSVDSGCSIYLLEDGTIQISGAKIILGNAEDDGGKTSQPYMRFDEFEKWKDGIRDSVANSLKDIESKIKNLQVAIQTSFAQSNCAPFGPDTGLIAALSLPDISTPYNIGSSTGNGSINNVNNSFDDTKNIQSKRVFGE